MNSIPKFAATVVVFMITVLVCISMIFAGIMMTSAQTHHKNAISTLEESGFDDTVIADCIQKAAEKNYTLTITKEINVSSVEHYKVVLLYNLRLPVLGNFYTGRIVGYAYPGALLNGGGTADHYYEIDNNGVLGIKEAYRWATGIDSYASDKGKEEAGSKNDQLPSELVIPTYFDGKKVVALRDYMLANNTALTKLTFEEGVEEIGDYAFQNCTGLTETVTMADSVKEIGAHAFDGCNTLNAVSFNAGSVLKTVGDYAFQNCVEFKDVVLPDTMVQNGYGAFKGCVNMTSYKAPFVGASPTASKKTGGYIGYIFAADVHTNNDAVTPASLSTVNITSYVTDYSCYKMKQLTTLILGDKITAFEMWPFAECTGLQKVTIPKSVETTEYAAFLDCTNLTDVVFEDDSKLTVLGATNFSGCTKLKNINLPSSLIEIGSKCFSECDSLNFSSANTGKIPNNVRKIGDGAFSYCDCSEFTTLTIPASVTTIEDSLCSRSTNVKTIQVAGGQSFCTGSYGELLTYDKTEIVQYPYAASTSYIIPNTIIKLRDHAFYYSEKLTTLDFSKADKLTIIGYGAVARCPEISNNITLPASVTTIDAEAFLYSGRWTEFTVGANVTSIGRDAMRYFGVSGCKIRLLMKTAPTIGSEAFYTYTVSSGSITKNSIYVENSVVGDVLVNGKNYRSEYTNIYVNGVLR